MKTLPPLGAHVSVAGGMPNAVARATELGCTAAQVFVKNANQWQGKELTADEAEAFKAARAASKVGPVVAHASYLINLCTQDRELLTRSAVALADELLRCNRLGIDALVVHPGAHGGAGDAAGLEQAAATINAVFATLPDCAPRLLLENTAGMGSAIGHRLEHLEEILARVTERDRVGVCIDTCHAFAAGYPIHQEAGYKSFFAELGKRIGFSSLACLHLNDSAKPFASRRDRHAHIGEGEIGRDAFARLLKDRRLHKVPMILETERGDDMEGHRKDLEVLRGLA